MTAVSLPTPPSLQWAPAEAVHWPAHHAQSPILGCACQQHAGSPQLFWLRKLAILCLPPWCAAGAAPWPNEAAGAAEHLRWVFYRQGFNDQEIVALSGAHTIGRAHKNRSGLGALTFRYKRRCHTIFAPCMCRLRCLVGSPAAVVG